MDKEEINIVYVSNMKVFISYGTAICGQDNKMSHDEICSSECDYYIHTFRGYWHLVIVQCLAALK